MDVSRIKIKDQLFTLKDPVSRDLANAASEKANKAAADAATAFNAAQEATTSANAANATANIAEDNATTAMNSAQAAVTTANAANAKAEQAINEPPVRDITYDEATSTISIYLTNKEAQA